MSYSAIVTKLKNVRPHPNADRVKLATCCGNQVVIGLDHQEDEVGIYFACDGVLSHEFCSNNNLYRDKFLNKNPDSNPGMFDANRRVRAQKFRGQNSDGFWVPVSNLDFIKGAKVFNEGDEFTELSGIPICTKYVNSETLKVARENTGKKTRVSKSSIMFKEHFDTAHFGRNVHKFEKGQTIIITAKLHGTSHRIGYVQLNRPITWIEKVCKYFGGQVLEKTWEYLSGTRRVVLAESSGQQYHDPTIRDKASNLFKDNLRKGETIYCEIVGFESTGAAIMPAANTLKLNDKEFTKKYGEIMQYSYGCAPCESKVYVYRITFTNEDGHTIDYSWDDVVKRCSEIGVPTVPHLRTLTLDELYQEDLKNGGTGDDRDLKTRLEEIVNSYLDKPDILDSKHICEGVCIRIEGGLVNQTFKQKGFLFKCLEGIGKESGVIDQEEVQDNITE